MNSWHLPRDFRFAGVHCGIRPELDRRDLALVVSDLPAAAAGVFTQNRLAAAPVCVCRERLPSGDARGIVICSGNANACTGQRGIDDARRMAALAASEIGCRAEQMLVCSTGVIGRHLPMPQIENGIRLAAGQLKASSSALDDAAHAIITTDTRIKVVTQSLLLPSSPQALSPVTGERGRGEGAEGVDVHIAGFAKGAAMIGPNMATMLAFVLTDAVVAPEELLVLAGRAAAQTFNCISVEGHTSTNDTLLFLANGATMTGRPPLHGACFGQFRERHDCCLCRSGPRHCRRRRRERRTLSRLKSKGYATMPKLTALPRPLPRVLLSRRPSLGLTRTGAGSSPPRVMRALSSRKNSFPSGSATCCYSAKAHRRRSMPPRRRPISRTTATYTCGCGSRWDRGAARSGHAI